MDWVGIELGDNVFIIPKANLVTVNYPLESESTAMNDFKTDCR